MQEEQRFCWWQPANSPVIASHVHADLRTGQEAKSARPYQGQQSTALSQSTTATKLTQGPRARA